MSLDVDLREWKLVSVYDANITHNLGKMAKAVGIYKHLWHPADLEIEMAGDLIEPLRAGLAELKAKPEKYKRLNPQNGWGTYEGLVKFVEMYLAACEAHPNAYVGADT